MRFIKLFFLGSFLFSLLTACSSAIYQPMSAINSNKGILGVEITGGMVTDGDEIYFVRKGGISKVNTSAPLPMLVDVYDHKNFDDVYALLLVNDYLYYTRYDKGSIYRIDLKEIIVKPEEVVVGLEGPDAMCVLGNELYVAEFEANRVSKVDLNNIALKPKVVIEGVDSPAVIKNQGDFIFVLQYADNKISKFNVTKENTTLIEVATNLERPEDMVVIGEELYVSEYLGNKLTKINVNTHKFSSVLTDLLTPSEITINGSEMFVFCHDDALIYRYDLNKEKESFLKEESEFSNNKGLVYSEED